MRQRRSRRKHRAHGPRPRVASACDRMTSATIKALYVGATLLEIAGVVCVIIGLTAGRRRARRFQSSRAYFGPVLRFPRGMQAPVREAQQAERQKARVEYEQKRQETEVLALLTGTWWEWLGALSLVAGIVVGTVANVCA